MSKSIENIFIFPVIFLGFFLAPLHETLSSLGFNIDLINYHMQDIYISCSFIMLFIYVLILNPSSIININTIIHIVLIFSLFIGAIFYVSKEIVLIKVIASYSLAIVSYSAGLVFYKKFGLESERAFSPVMKLLAVILSISLVLYIYSYIDGNIKRVGFSNPIVSVFVYFYLQQLSIIFLPIIAISTILVGKRAELISFLIVLIIFFRSRKKIIYTFKAKILLIVIFSISIFIIANTDFLSGYFDRWFVEYYSVEDDWINRYSSGRYKEVLFGFSHIIDNPINLFTGIGGINDLNIEDEPERWYIHSALLTHFIYSGVLPSLLLYLYIMYLIVRSFRVTNYTFAFYYTAVGLASAIIGMNMFVNPIFWFFAAILRNQISQSQLNLKHVAI